MSSLIGLSDRMYCEKVFSSSEQLLMELRRNYAPDAILLDIELPGMNGVDAIERIKALAPMTDVIMLTIYDDDENVFRAICSGASGYLLKNIPAQRLVESILEITFGGAPINPRIARKVLELFSRRAAPRENYNLTSREKDILRRMVEGLTKKAIAEQLNVSCHTIDSHVKKIYHKLQVHSRSRAVVKVLKEKLV
jgi:DNA-binding NarL/FixJ family response regulator